MADEVQAAAAAASAAAAPAADAGVMSDDQMRDLFDSPESDAVKPAPAAGDPAKPAPPALGADGKPVPAEAAKPVVVATPEEEMERRGKALLAGEDPDAEPVAPELDADGNPVKPAAAAEPAPLDIDKALEGALVELKKDPEFAQFHEDFPEAAKFSTKLVAAALKMLGKVPDMGKAVEDRIGAIQKQADDFIAGAKAEFTQRAFLMELSNARPEWRQTIATPEYKTWLGKQSEAVKRLGCVPDVKSATMLLDAFDRAAGKGAKPAKSGSYTRLAAAAPNGGIVKPAAGAGEELSDEERRDLFNQPDKP